MRRELLGGKAHSRSLGYLRISCQGSVASVNLVRLSLKKAAYVAVDWCGVVGNPEPARDDKGEGSAHLSSRYTGWTEPQVIRDFHLFGWAKGVGAAAGNKRKTAR